MAASMAGVLASNVQSKVDSSKILVVGAGGIGCELIKNLVLTGFRDIELIDLDTIDVSNLNRQFLFRKEHVGKSKSQVAKESAQRFNPNAKIVAYHDSIMNPEYKTDFFKQFDIVLNALDNRAARNHVNRMCLAADVPLVESGTAGYLGQVTVIKKGLTECYECQPKPRQKTFPGCTIRNTPSELIHCVVWAKHLFNQLFGEEDPDEDVSPDTQDPELTAEAGESALSSEAKTDGGIERTSTRAWAKECGYSPEKLFNKLFRDDIRYLLSMEKLWKKRRPPTALEWSELPDDPSGNGNTTGVIQDQKVWTVKECVDVFTECLATLKSDLQKQGEDGILVWDKDDTAAMDFVTSVANIRAHIFGIVPKSRFDIKSMAGNIIPAIATTNAIIAGLIVMQAFHILSGNLDKCKTVYLNRQPNPRKKLLVPCLLEKANPKCYVCSAKPEVNLVLNTGKISIKTLEERILKGQLGMVAPDVEIEDGKGTIIISSEEGETEGNAEKMLSDFGIANGSRLKADDFLQNYNIVINIAHVEKLDEEKEFGLVGDLEELRAKQKDEGNGAEAGGGDQKETQASDTNVVESDDDMVILEDDDVAMEKESRGQKRKADSDIEAETAKRSKSVDEANPTETIVL
ncbi:SUMO-activating enzyme subunit 2-like [Liolophura sinensis]|uniref:SUMO-activating enzyme subunit 2-like n=1 Tax=Liolophura sinensis TaxID=3198878 RepID=UPI003158BE44